MASKLLCEIAVLFTMSGLVYSTSSGERSIEDTIPMPPTSPHATIDLANTKQASSSEEDGVNNAVNDVMKAFANLGNENRDGKKSSESYSFDYDIFNCSIQPTVDKYCTDFRPEVREYFKNDLSISGLLATVLRKDVVEDLQANCPPLSWCLTDTFHQYIIQGKPLFYSSNPLCSDDVWACLETMLAERMDCDDKQLKFLVNAVDLLCSMEEVDRLPVGEECYARTMETLYIVYADLTNPAGSHIGKLERGCSADKVEMTKTYMCAFDVCTNNQRSLLQKFEFWKDIAATATETATACKITHTCQLTNTTDDYDGTYENDNTRLSDTPAPVSGEGTNTDIPDLDVLEELLDEIVQEVESETNTTGSAVGVLVEGSVEGSVDDSASGEVNKNTIGETGENDKAVVFGLLVMTSVLVVGFLGLAFLTYRRFCRNKCGYDKSGYSKLLDEEADLLKAEYS